ncbi:WXG100 family type VII secretion target [Amycolatopsis albispora]|uniref:WXG100 family type VII secretion target n=1 Tax=Amycolatopsis albispora TaxID=1804986 RepID=A0A344LFP5_9PSEU|nr:hypothetical protein [Amycolatopsis albispora]AXB46869.1 hypothetical protein A4R43_34140 [Amycolatopsis albispora]
MAKTWDEVKAVLDDPAVSPDKKQALLQSWSSSSNEAWTADGSKRDEISRYQEAYNGHPIGFGPFSEEFTDELYEDAKKEGSENSYNEREHQKEVDAGRTGLDSAQPPTTGGGGTKTSDELLKHGEAGLKVFEDFGPLLGKIPEDCRGRTRPLDYNTDIKKRYEEQKGINFAEFLTDSSDFTTAAGQVRQALKDTRGQLDGLSKSWTGPAADKANEHYNEKINTPGDELVGFLEGSAAATSTAVDAVYQLVKGKVDAVIDMYTPTVGKADLDMATTVINIANDSAAGKDEMEKVAGWMDVNFGTNMREKLNDDGCCDDDEIKKEGIRLAKQWIQNQFNVEMWDGLWTSFDTLCTETKEFVDEAYTQLNEVMGKAENGFANAAKENPPPKEETGGGGDNGGGGGGTGGGGSGSGGGGTGSGGGGTGGGGTPPGATEPPSTEDKGTNPITGKPLEVDPETGKPYPIDPETGEAIKDAGDDDDTMTVKQGDNEIKMSEPGDDGKMDISIDDGTPPPKDYKLDFGNGELGPDGKPVEGAEGEAGAEGEKVYKPGPDGKIVIEDNGVKITAEQPQGPKGPTVVTVDDGKGEPVTYTLGADNKGEKDALNGLDDSDPTGGAGRPDELASGGGGAGAPGAEGDDGFSAPGGLDLPEDGEVETKPAADGGAGGSGGGGAGGDSGGSAGGSGGSGGSAAAVGGSAGGDLGDTGSLSAGAQVGAASPEPAAAAGLGSTPGGAGVGAGAPAAAAAGAGAGGMGGMGMMGGMGAMGGGAGGGQSGDQERNSSQYRVAGNIFETSGAGGRISGSLDEEGDRSIRYDR